MMGEGRLLVTPEEAAAALAVSRARVYAWLATGELASVKLGASRRIEVFELQQFVDRAKASGDLDDVRRSDLQRVGQPA